MRQLRDHYGTMNSTDSTCKASDYDQIRDLPEQTPAFVIDEAALARALQRAIALSAATGCKILFAVKAFSFQATLELMAPHLNGFAVSSPFEAKLARSVLGDTGTIHLTTPAIRKQDRPQIARWCDYVAFNSWNQWHAHRTEIGPNVRCGLRVNTGLPFVRDHRYDPCRPDSRLGEPLPNIARILDGNEGVEGLLIHTNCESTDPKELEINVGELHSHLSHRLHDGRLSWINLGGGYLFQRDDGSNVNLEPLHRAISLLGGYGLEVFIEPGNALIRNAGYIVATVLEIQETAQHRTAILDTSVNHMPEVFEYQFEPDVAGHDDEAPWACTLAGATCLAGDVFGQYQFPQPLSVGDRVVFPNSGAYTLVKAHTFNGVNLPTIYHLSDDGRIEMKRRYTYEDYARRWEGGQET